MMGVPFGPNNNNNDIQPLFFTFVFIEEVDTLLLVSLENVFCCSPFCSESFKMKCKELVARQNVLTIV
jgi:hypothetical protein